MKRWKGWSMNCDVGEATEGFKNELWRRSSDGRVGEWVVTYVKRLKAWIMSSAHSPSFQSLHLRHSWLSNPFLALSTSQLILQPFRCFTYVTPHSPTLLSFLLRHSRAHSPSFQSLHLRHSWLSNPSLALSTSQLILQPFRCFTYVTAHSPTLISLLLRYRIFTYVTWRAAHAVDNAVF